MDKDKINLLIVDDEETFLESMKKRLKLRGFAVTCVNRGDKAIEAARQHPVDQKPCELEHLLEVLKEMEKGAA
jgi:ActR/RegA family two-component response regulator